MAFVRVWLLNCPWVRYGCACNYDKEIKRKNYKDSKKINILVTALIIDTCIGVPLWIMFQHIAAAILSRLAYNIGTILAAVLCQVILILPKIFPLVVRKYRC